MHTYAYDLNGNLDKVVYQNGVEHDYTYNALNRLTGLNVLSSSVSLRDYTYSLRASGHRRQISDSIEGRSGTYSYDNRYRMTGEIISGAASGANGTTTYSYDAVGNRETRTTDVTGLTAQTYSYNGRDLLNSASTTFDANGNTTSSLSPLTSQPTTDIYDFEDRLIERQDGSKFVSITYDAMGNRIKKVVSDFAVNDVERHYLVDSNNLTGYAQVMEELVPDTVNPLQLNVDKAHTYGLDIISITQALPEGNPTGFETHYYLYDGLGSVVGLTDINGDQVASYEYDAFGNLLHESSSVPNNYLFTGEQYDRDLSLYFLRARYYNPENGRFHTSDPFEGFRNDPTSLHKYLYAHGNPVSYTDPSGRNSSFAFGLGQLVHSAIEQDFVSKQDVFLRQKEKTVGSLMSEYCGGGYVSPAEPGLRTDLSSILLVNSFDDSLLNIGEVWEIKPEKDRALGITQLSTYLATLNTACPKTAWAPGTSYIPPTTIPIMGIYIATIWLEQPGLVLYKLSRSQQREGVPVTVPSPVRQPDLHRLVNRHQTAALVGVVALATFVAVSRRGLAY